MNDKEIALERIANAQHFILTAPASRWAVPHEREKTLKHVYELLEFLKPIIEGEKVVVQELRTEPREIPEAERIFQAKTITQH
jgi:hypothetical protein